MKVITARNICADLCDCTPKQWVSLCNTFLLLLVTFMCGVVIYETYDLDQRFVNILDSSGLTIDLTAVDILESQMTPYWRKVADNIEVYSAFHDIANAKDPILLVIGRVAKNWTSAEDIRCLIKYPDDEIRLVNISAMVTTSSNAAFFSCNTIKEVVPEKVAVISLIDKVPKQWLKVELYDSSRRTIVKVESMAACVKPLSESSLTVQEIAEFIAFYEIIGVKNFYFYNYQTSSEVLNFLRQLIANGHAIQVYPWISRDSDSDSHILASEYVQDCIYRSIVKHNKVILVGVKDFVVPKQFMLIDMLEHIRLTLTNSSLLSLKYSTFCDGDQNVAFKPSMLERMVLHDVIKPPDVNYILQPYDVAMKKVSDFTENRDLKAYVLSEDDALVHRYENNCSTVTVLDTGIHKYLPFLKNSAVFAQMYKSNLQNS